MTITVSLTGKTLAAAAVLVVAGGLAAASAVLSAPGWNPASPEAIVEAMLTEKDHVQPLELARWILDKRTDYQLVDLREPWEYDDYHIPGAVNIPLSELFTPQGLSKLDRSKLVVVYGLGAGHPAQAQLLLTMRGYRALSLKEGITAWWDQVMTPQSLRGEKASPSGYRQAKALREQFMGGPSEGASKGAAPLPPPPPTAAPEPGKTSPRKLKLGRGCS
ncbi:MAG: rhodanese-like domain-containing protein [Bryobacteraceae bacterium]